MIFLAGLILFLTFGLAGRVRGQAESWSNTVSRYAVWGIPVGALVFGMTHNPLYGLVSVACAGLGATLGYWGQFDFTAPGNWNIQNYVKLTLTGMFRFVPLFILSCFADIGWHVLPAVIAGATFVPIYMFCSRHTKSFTLGTLFTGWTCWAEFLFWGVIGAALAAGLAL